MALLDDSPNLRQIVSTLNCHCNETYPEFFSTAAIHPCLPLRHSKIIHDSLWGTNRYSFLELAILDSPLLQRLRNIRQTGLAYQIYPGANHNRLEHSLGVLTLASRVFDAIAKNGDADLRNIAALLGEQFEPWLRRIAQELRLAALLHDTGHSLFSHASESAYGFLPLLSRGRRELQELTGKRKSSGSGEVISFCLALTPALGDLIVRAQRLEMAPQGQRFTCNQEAIALYIVGRSPHPSTQFLGDIISSALDADKLDYLIRDANSAGLPMRYDLERYLHSVKIGSDFIADEERKLERLYNRVGCRITRGRGTGPSAFSGVEVYRLKLPAKAINAIEQVVISKFMLFGYIYHHPKVRAAEGLLERALQAVVAQWQADGLRDEDILCKFMSMEDSAIDGFSEAGFRRIKLRLLPREVYRLNSALLDGAPRQLLKRWLIQLQDKERQAHRIAEFEDEVGKAILRENAEFAATPRDALTKAGIWLDIPKPPKFEELDRIVSTDGQDAIRLGGLLPVDHWADAYMAYRYSVRIFAFSEFVGLAERTGRAAMEAIVQIHGDEFYRALFRKRTE